MLPQDPVILFSLVNTKLRDQYSSLEELCNDLDADRDSLVAVLSAAGWTYDREHNQFR